MLKWYLLEKVILEVKNKVDPCGTFTIKFNNYLIVVIIRIGLGHSKFSFYLILTLLKLL